MASGYMFSHYFPGDGIVNTAPTTPGNEQIHPYWFNGSFISSFPGFDWAWLKIRLKATKLALKAIWGGHFERSLGVVKAVAHDPSSRNISTWGEINRLTVSNPGHGENTYRHLMAQIQIGGPDAGLLAELAYRAYRKERS